MEMLQNSRNGIIMQDLSKILNQRIAEKIANNQPSPDQLGTKVKFDELLETKKNSMDELMNSVMSEQKSGMDVQSMDHINVNLADVESVTNNNKGHSWQKGLDVFSQLNDNFNSMNMAVEVLSDPSTKLNKQQLLAYQAGMGNMTVNIELMTKMVQNGVKAVQRFTDMQLWSHIWNRVTNSRKNAILTMIYGIIGYTQILFSMDFALSS